jgi:hypothetical protein
MLQQLEVPNHMYLGMDSVGIEVGPTRTHVLSLLIAGALTAASRRLVIGRWRKRPGWLANAW